MSQCASLSSRHDAMQLCRGVKHMARGGRPRVVQVHALDRARWISVLQGATPFRLGPALDGTLVIDDDQNKSVIQQAHKEGRLSFGYSAGGCLFPYYVGVSGALQDAGVLREETKLGGASAGSLIAACIKSGLPMDEVIEQCMRLMRDCRENGTMHRLGPLLEHLLEESLPDDAHVKCTDRAYVAVTRALPRIKGELVSRFDSREDLIRALRTSCHIPFYLDGQWYIDFRGKAHVDGGITNFIPIPPDTVGVRVCCFPSKQLSRLYRIGISPDSFEPCPYSLAQMVRWAFEPASEEFVAAFIEKGRKDAMAWCHVQGLVEEKEAAEVREQQQQGQVAAAREAATGEGSMEAQKEKAAQQGVKLHVKGAVEQAVGADQPSAPAQQALAAAKAIGAAPRPGAAAQQQQQQQEETLAQQQGQQDEEGQEGGNKEGDGLLGSALKKAAGVAGAAAAVAAAAKTLGQPPL